MRIAALLAAFAAAAVFAQDADVLHGERVADPFRHLENPSEPRTQAFYREQADRTRAALDLLPGRAALLSRVRALSEAGTVVTQLAVSNGRVFYLKRQPREMQSSLYVLDAPNAKERLLVAAARLEAGSAIDWYAPSPDAKHVAYGVSKGGSEDSVLHVAAVSPLRELPVAIDRARFNSRMEWHPDGRSFYYARIPAGNPPGARRYAHLRVYRHVLGRPADKDEVVFAAGVGGARDVPDIHYPSIHVPVDSRWAYAVVRDGVRRELAVHVAEQRDLERGQPRWRKMVAPEDGVIEVTGWRDDLYLLSQRDAPHARVLLVKATAADLRGARVLVPEGDAVIRSMALARDALYLRTMVAGVDRLERLTLGFFGPGKPQYLRTPFNNAISQLVADPRRPGALLRMQGWIDAPMIAEVDARSGDLRNTQIQPAAAADFSAIDEVRLYAQGHDGTRIPVTLIYRANTTLSRDNPTLLIAYGSYGIVQSPSFDPTRLAWLERGGIIAIAHVRGGGEHGAAWHAAGRFANKTNTVRDLISVAEYLVSYGFTRPAKLAIQGTSAGGIPVGGALVRRPDLFAAVVARVPVMDMLRMETSANGPANIPEFGSVATREGYLALKSISAYHQVADGIPYPAVLLTAGMNDPRVDPWQPGKMAARLQAASTSARPVLLRVDFASGHGLGTSRTARDEETADIYSFLLWQMGDPAFQPPGLVPRPLPELVPAEPRGQ
jgi:prolyl oligopeptidase